MARSRDPKPHGLIPAGPAFPARTPGPLGVNDQGDPLSASLSGDTPGCLGINDHGQPGPLQASPSTLSQRDALAEPFRQTWQLTEDKVRLTIVRRVDLRWYERYSTDFRLLAANLDGWLATDGPRQAIREMCGSALGRPAEMAARASGEDQQGNLKRQLEEAFRLKELVILLRGGGGSTEEEEAKVKDQAPPVAPTPPPKGKQKTWIEIELVDEKERPVPKERYRIQLPDGTTVEGTLDVAGRARLDGLDPGQCQVSFPDLDGKEWKPA